MDGQKICQDDPLFPMEIFPSSHLVFKNMLIDFQHVVQLDNPQATP